jgi:putative transposase
MVNCAGYVKRGSIRRARGRVRSSKCCALRVNSTMLQQRRDSWTTRRIPYTSKQQYAEITELRACDPSFAAVYRKCLDATLHRLDLAFAAFFRRVKSGEEPGYPRFKSGRRRNQIGDDQRPVYIPGVGRVRLRKGRYVPEFGRAFVVTKNGRWYAIFEAHRHAARRNRTGVHIVIDRGIRVLAALSDGTKIANIRPGSARRVVVERHAQKLDTLTKKMRTALCSIGVTPSGLGPLAA